MSDHLRKLTPGEVLRGYPSDFHNALFEVWQKFNRQGGRGQGQADSANVKTVDCEVINMSGAAIDADFPVLQLTKPVFTTEDNPRCIYSPVVFEGETPIATTRPDQVAIVQGPINNAGGGRHAIMWGPTWADVAFVAGIASTHCRPIAGEDTHLAASLSGIPIIWQPPNPGADPTARCLILLGQTSLEPEQFGFITEVVNNGGATQARYTGVAATPELDFPVDVGLPRVKLVLLKDFVVYNPDALTTDQLEIEAFDVRRDGVPAVGEVVRVFTSSGQPVQPGDTTFDLIVEGVPTSRIIYCDVVNTTDYLRDLPTWSLPATQYLYHEADSANIGWVEVDPGGGGATLVEGCGIDLSGTDPITIAVSSAALQGDGIVPGAGCSLSVGEGYCLDVLADEVRLDLTENADYVSAAMQFLAHFNPAPDFDDWVWKTAGNYSAAALSQLLVNFAGTWTWETLDNYDDTANEQALIHINGNWQWVTAWQVKVNSSDTQPDYLHDTFALPVTATFNSAQDVTISNQTVSNNWERMFLDASTIPGHAGSTTKALTISGAGRDLAWAEISSGSFTEGCAIIIASGEISVDLDALVAPLGGLSALADCGGLAIDYACGLIIDAAGEFAGQIRVNVPALAGPGLSAVGGSGQCAMQVNTGLGVTITSDAVALYNTDYFGSGDEFYVSIGGAFKWRTAWQIKVNSSDTTPHYLHDTFVSNVAATFNATYDIVIKNQTAPGNDFEQLFWDVHNMTGWHATNVKVLTLSSGTPIWADPTGGGSGPTAGYCTDISSTTNVDLDLTENAAYVSAAMQFLIHLNPAPDPDDWIWITAGGYDTSASAEQVLINEGSNDWQWRIAYMVKVSADDTTARHLIDKFKDGGTYESGEDFLVVAQEVDGGADENVKLFIQADTMDNWLPSTTQILGKNDTLPTWKTIAQWLNLLPGYVAGNNQSIGHDASGATVWQDDTTTCP